MIYSKDELKRLSKKKIPNHIAIVLDGNRRWAKKNSYKSLVKGHERGADVLENVVLAAEELGIKTLTVWAFSTDNWKRTSFEVNTLISLFEKYLEDNQKKMVERGVKFHVIGDLQAFPKKLQEKIKNTINATKKGKTIDLIVGLNYGGRDDIKRAFQKLIQDCLEKKIEKKDVSEKMISQYLDTKEFNDPDLIIRTSNENRLSNFMLWQAAYAELYITKDFWPDFTPKHLLEAVLEFQNRERRKGK